MVAQTELKLLIEGNQIPISSLKKISMIYEQFLKYPKLTKKLIKVLIKVWSEDEEASRVLAFLILVKVLQKKNDYVEPSIKLLYTSYIKGCKFVNVNTIGWVQFMQRSLCEVLRLNLDEAYQHAFVYVRQMGITLRKAISNPKKEFTQSVYNWQFVNCLALWSRFISENAHSHELLASLVHPLVHILSGCIKLSPSARWLPLRFHCVSYLNLLSRGQPDIDAPPHRENISNISHLIPVLPAIMEVFQIVDLNKRTQATSHSRPMNPRLMLHGSTSQIKDQRYRDMIVDCVYELLVENLAAHANSPAFPEYCLALVSTIKDFIKKCKVSNYTKPFKGLLSKIDENVKFISSKRTLITSLTDKRGMDLFRETINAPFFSYAESYRKARKTELERLSVGANEDKENDDEEDSEIEETVRGGADVSEDESSADFGSDDDDEEEDEKSVDMNHNESGSSDDDEDLIEEEMDVDDMEDEVVSDASFSDDANEEVVKESKPQTSQSAKTKSRKKIKKLPAKKQINFKKPKSKKVNKSFNKSKK